MTVSAARTQNSATFQVPDVVLRAIADAGGSKVSLVIGAGCSLEPPTNIPLAGDCSKESHDRLVADGTIAATACSNPYDLSCLADAVVLAKKSQDALVQQLASNYPLKSASPNPGHTQLAALLCEGAIAAVVTLNFDLAISHAVANIGAGQKVGLVDGPESIGQQKAFNVYYIHRNAYETNTEKWVLQTAAIQSDWRGTWQPIVTTKALMVPVVVFVGLGSPAAVLTESVRLIKESIAGGTDTYQVGPGDSAQSTFFQTLRLDQAHYIRAGWCQFMEALSRRVTIEHVARLRKSASDLVHANSLHQEDLTAMLARLEEIGLVHLGGMRACWLHPAVDYWPDEEPGRGLVADLLLAAAFIARERSVEAIPTGDGIVEFRRDGRTIASYIFASGLGTQRYIAVEATLPSRSRRHRGLASQPAGAIVSGTVDMPSAPSAPADIVSGDEPEDILSSPSHLRMFHVEALRQNPAMCSEVVE